MLRQKAITLINIGGLAIGMAVFILVSLYVTEEFSHEQRWDKADRIARTVSTLKFYAESSLELGSGSARALDALATFFPDEVETGRRVFSTGQSIVVDHESVQGQFLVEALCQAVVAFLIALALQELISPVFESMIQTQLITQTLSLPYLFQSVLLIVVVDLSLWSSIPMAWVTTSFRCTPCLSWRGAAFRANAIPCSTPGPGMRMSTVPL